MPSKSASNASAKKDDDGANWNKKALAREGQLAKKFRDDVHDLAVVFARHENSETVVVRHVEHAHSSLSRLGLSRRKLIHRSEFWASIGGILIGAALSLADGINMLPKSAKPFHDWLVESGAAVTSAWVLLAAGVIIVAIAWYKGSAPTAP